MARNCPICDDGMEKIIYCGLPGHFCFKCSCMAWLSSYAPAIATETENGPAFAIMTYEGSYWPALWHWLTHKEEGHG